MANPASKSAVLKALGGNAIITVAKGIAWSISGSGAMLAETVHSAVDTTNQGLLLIGHQRSLREPTRRHPYGYFIEANFWALLAAIGISVFGGGIALWHGIEGLMHPHELHNIGTVLAILAFATVVELWVLYSILKDLSKTRGDKRWVDHIRDQPAGTLTVVLEDAAAVAGCIFAAIAVGLSYYWETSLPDAIAQLVIGGMLVLVGVYLIIRNWGVLIGQAISRDREQEISQFIADLPSIDRVENVMTRRLAPHAFTLKAEVIFSGGELAGQIMDDHDDRALDADNDKEIREALGRFANKLFIEQAKLVDDYEKEIEERFPEAVYIDLEPHLRRRET